MACYDIRGQQVLDACRSVGLAVPDEVAVIGVDNDDLLCDLSDPPLTSVIPNTHRTGYEAAALLDKMMAGPKVAAKPTSSRQSASPPVNPPTSSAIDDRNVARAMHHIRQHACDGINVQSVLQVVPQSRRLLESRFKKA